MDPISPGERAEGLGLRPTPGHFAVPQGVDHWESLGASERPEGGGGVLLNGRFVCFSGDVLMFLFWALLFFFPFSRVLN